MADRFKSTFASALILLALAVTTARAQNKIPDENLNTPLPLASGTAAAPPGSGLDDGTLPGAKNRAAQASPTAAPHLGTAMHIGTAVMVRVSTTFDTGSVRNGDTIHGTLAAPLRTTSGSTLAIGTPVEGTIVSAAKAGMLQSGGVLSLQLTRVGTLHIVTDVAEIDGQEGHRDVADSAPEKGSEATVQAGSILTFNVLENGAVPGLVFGAPVVQSKEAGIGTNPSRSTGQPNTAPGVSQRPIGGATQGTVPASPKG